ncbi:MAG: DNA-binding transcriptional regulator [Verrucomicrobiae bacterium]|nr:DNA-binding transcriptional regulator [Verrucomicrobiae bacterium]
MEKSTKATLTFLPQVAVCVDKARNYGRKVLQGIADYTDTVGRWSLHVDPEATGSYSTDWLENWKGDGILAFVESKATARRLIASKIPCVEVFGHQLDLKLPQVGNDDEAIGRMAAEHLLSCCFKHFAFCGYEREPWSERRRSGFEWVISKNGFEVTHFFSSRRSSTLAEGQIDRDNLAKWLVSQPKPLAIMACSDRHGQKLLNVCRRLKINVPEEVAVIGVDNDEETCRLADPPLSSVRDDARKVGYEAAQLLDKLMTNPAPPSALFPLLIPPLGIAIRQSTDVTAVDDPLVASAMKCIREEACSGLRVADLLSRFNVSRSVLYRRFHDSLNRSPHEEILRVQIGRATRLLDESDFTQERIAELCGFQHSEYLGVAFKRKLGITPGDYRRRLRK